MNLLRGEHGPPEHDFEEFRSESYSVILIVVIEIRVHVIIAIESRQSKHERRTVEQFEAGSNISKFAKSITEIFEWL